MWDGVLHKVLSILILLDGVLHTGQTSLVGSCDHNVSQDSTAISGIKEITNSAAAVSSDSPVESGTSTKSTEGGSATQPVAAEDNDIGSCGPEDAQTFLDKMQSLAFNSGYVLYACMLSVVKIYFNNVVATHACT